MGVMKFCFGGHTNCKYSRCASFYHRSGRKNGHHAQLEGAIVCDTRNKKGDCHEEPRPELVLGDEAPIRWEPIVGESARTEKDVSTTGPSPSERKSA